MTTRLATDDEIAKWDNLIIQNPDGGNVFQSAKLAETIRLPVIASGGLTDLDDVRALCAAAGSGISGAITGRAIYEGSIDFAEAQQLADHLSQ